MIYLFLKCFETINGIGHIFGGVGKPDLFKEIKIR